jgi:N-acetylglutamate synthase-like GNAT family acetyltransferase
VIRAARSDDYPAIASVMDSWWGRPVVAILPRLFLEHFHPTSHVAEDQLGLAGFVVGFLSPANPELAYIHTVAVRPDLRSAGVARQLYERFFAVAHRAGRTTVSAVTSPAIWLPLSFIGGWASPLTARCPTITAPLRTASCSSGGFDSPFWTFRRAKPGLRASEPVDGEQA